MCFAIQIWLGLLLFNGGIYRIDKMYEQIISHMCYLRHSAAVNITNFELIVVRFFLFRLSDFNKYTVLLLQQNTF